MRRTHKLLSIILAIMMVISVIPITASAAETSGTCGDNLTWAYDEATYTLTISGEGDMYDYQYNTSPWQSHKSKIKAVIICDGVTSVGDCAFYYCENLTGATIPEGVTTIGDYAFYYCEELQNVVIPNSVTSIGRYAFAICQEIKSINIPANVNTIGDRAFLDCYKLASITVDSDNQYFSSDDYGVLFDKDKTTLIQYAIGNRTKDYTIPDGVETIESQAFYWSEYIKNIIIPDSVTTIEASAFSNCHYLESVVIGNGATTIDNFAFFECNYLKSIIMGKGVKTIGLKAFYECESIEIVYYAGTKTEWNEIAVSKYNDALLDATIICGHNYNEGTITGICGENLTWLYDMTTHILTISGSGAMNDYNWDNHPWEYFKQEIEEIIINNGVTTIGVKAFNSLTNLESVTIPESVTEIGDSAFYGCSKLKAVTIPDDVTTIGEYAFYECASIESIVIPDKVTTIAWSTFGSCTNLADVTIGENVTTIGLNAFHNCSKLTTITIPASVEAIGAGAFYGCKKLEKITVDGENKYYSSDKYGVLFDKAQTTLILYPMANTGTSYTIPNSVTTIGDNAFNGCANLKNIIIPNSVTNIGGEAFYCCINLENVTIPASVETIGAFAFGHCDNFTSVKIPDSVITIGDGAFYSCDLLATVTIPDSVTTLGDSAFENCVSLANVKIGDGITKLKSDVFSGCISLTNISIPNGVTGIQGGTFSNCTSLESITIPNSVTGIGYGSFEGCTAIADVHYLGTEDEWNSIKIYNANEPLLNATIHYEGFTGIKDNNFYKDDVMQKAYQLVEFKGDFYFIGDRHEIVKNKKAYLNEARINGLTYEDGTPITVGYYDFDENGKMIIREGLVGNNIYKNNVQLKAYQLVEVDGDFYFIGDRHEIIKNKKAYLNEARINGLTYADGTEIATGYYDFDENGKMVILNGLVGNHIYKNNTQLKAYQLVEVDGDFYFIGDRHEIVKDKKVYLTEERINGLTYEDGTPITAGYYDFDENGKMIILNGVVGNNIYKNNTKLKAYQLVEVDGDFYFIGDRHEIVKNQNVYLNEERINGLTYEDGTPIAVGYYNVDADGKLIMQ